MRDIGVLVRLRHSVRPKWSVVEIFIAVLKQASFIVAKTFDTVL